MNSYFKNPNNAHNMSSRQNTERHTPPTIVELGPNSSQSNKSKLLTRRYTKRYWFLMSLHVSIVSQTLHASLNFFFLFTSTVAMLFYNQSSLFQTTEQRVLDLGRENLGIIISAVRYNREQNSTEKVMEKQTGFLNHI